MIGQKFDRLTVLNRNGSDQKGNALYDCVCDCGNSKTVVGYRLKNGNTRSCGCLQIEHCSLMTQKSVGVITLDLLGKKFNSLTPVEQTRVNGQAGWTCLCDCGEITSVRTGDLTSGGIKSCGSPTHRIGHNKTHGMSDSPTYESWGNMKSRCDNPNNPHYHNYGGRGITYSDSWKSFENFLADMGERPEGRTLDRKDTNSSYSPMNCHWATRKEQQNNLRSSRILVHNGESGTISEWAEKLGIPRKRIASRLEQGASVEEALSPTFRGKPI
jgi:hypothetical protein